MRLHPILQRKLIKISTKKNKNILRQNKGNGYWLWKPHFIQKSLNCLHWGDFLFYCDSGSYFIQPITPIIDIILETGQDIIAFELDHIERAWTKRDTFLLMDCDIPKYSESKQRLGGFIMFRKTKFTMNFVAEFLSYVQDERLITDLENQCHYPNYLGFREHRHDQSIFSLLTKKHDLKAYRDPSQFGNSDEAVLSQFKLSTTDSADQEKRCISPLPDIQLLQEVLSTWQGEV